ncbi:MAG: pilus assembly protein [Rhodospirillaceae bacterium]|nr:pilus assembly protein [Rhodospirillaceae bacterium]
MTQRRPAWRLLHRALLTLRADRRGAIFVMTALLMPIMVGIIGLGVEVGLWFQEKRSTQTAVDAAAIAAVYESLNGDADTASITTEATADAVRNGFDTSADTITINNPPSSGSYTSDSGAYEVTLSKTTSLLFAGYMLNAESINISARAVARAVSSGEACVLSLDTSDTEISVGGSGDVTYDGCQVASNSSDSDALSVSGSGSLTTDCYSVVGGVSSTDGLTTDADCSAKTGAAAIDDPYSALATPAYSGCDESGGYTQNATGTFTFDHDDAFDTAYVICGDLWVKKGTLVLEPSLYIIEGDIKSNAQGSISGTGVTIILMDGGQINNFNGSSTVNLSTPTGASAGDWQGIVFYQDRDDASSSTGNNCNTLNGNSSSTFEGTMYFPNQEINVNGGNSSTSTCMQIVALRVGFSGSSAMDADNSQCAAAGVDPIEIPGAVALVE